MTTHEIDLLALGETIGNLSGRMTGIEDTVKDLDARVSDIEKRQGANTIILERIDDNTTIVKELPTDPRKMTAGELTTYITYKAVIGIGVAGVSLFVLWFLAKFIIFPNIAIGE